jgi:hypothetical protein
MFPAPSKARPPWSIQGENPGTFGGVNGGGNLKFHLRAAAGRISIGQNSPEQEAVMAKGQMRAVKEKKKPKADKDKPKQMSAYQASQMQGTPKK